MEAASFAKIVERRVRKALKPEEENGESQLGALKAFGQESNDTITVLLIHTSNMTDMSGLPHEMTWGKHLSMQSASKPIKLITALQMIKPEGHTLWCVCVCELHWHVFMCVWFTPIIFMQQHAKEEEEILLCIYVCNASGVYFVLFALNKI